ncbi:MAG: guanylate kinase [Halanaerobiaceae bacterium]
MSKSNGKLFILSGPSGVGKGTVIDELSKEFGDIEYSISVTTRPPRRGEEDGVDYYFVTEDEFNKMKENDELIEWAEVHNHLYGTPRKNVEMALEQGQNMILEIDIEGAKQIRSKFPDAVLIFLLPPSIEELKHRLEKRNTENEKVKNLRLNNARKELDEIIYYDYQVENARLSETVSRIKNIILKETNQG